MADLSNIEFNNIDNIGGIPGVIYAAHHKDVAKFAKIPLEKNILKIEESQKLTGIYEMKTGKKLIKLLVVSDKSSLDDDGQGETGGRSNKSVLKFRLQGRTPENKGFSRHANNGRFIFFVYDENLGHYNVIGATEEHPARMTECKAASGEGAAGANMTDFTFQCDGVGQTPYIVLTDTELETLLTPAVAPVTP